MNSARNSCQPRDSVLLATALAVGLCSCGNPGDSAVARAGGALTIANRTSGAFGQPAPNLDEQDLERHLAGDAAFEAEFVTAPSDLNPGLGPLFNNFACSACHLNDGRGMPVAGNGPQLSQALVRVSLPRGAPAVPGGPALVPGVGDQIRDHAVFGHDPDATVSIAWVERTETYGDGTSYSLRAPQLTVTPSAGKVLPDKTLQSLRLPPPVFGLGLLEAVDEQTIVDLADEDDADGDGVSGRVNRVWDVEQQRMVLGRFGLKENQPNLRQQAAAAYASDIGVSNPVFSGSDGSPEIGDDTLRAVVFYLLTLAVPQRTLADDPQVKHGEVVFRSAGCGSCHVDTLQTGDHDIEVLSNQTIHPYTDLLLHDMGEGLADHRPDFAATGREWRTSPLWGIGLTHTVLPYSGFLHDGRARTLQEAVLWHGGEAEQAKEAFRTMPADDRDALIRFLQSL